jgi:hypothetical protein
LGLWWPGYDRKQNHYRQPNEHPATVENGASVVADLLHAELCIIAAKWLKKPLSTRGHGCQVSFTETRISFVGGESPDAIGFRVSTHGYGGGSTVVECKTSRGDFRRDSEKPHRAVGGGMGRFRYYLCPEALLAPSDVPAGWGLLYVNAKKAVSVVSGATLSIREPGIYDCPHDAFTETLLLANLLHRVGDAEQLNARLRAADRLNQHLQRLLAQKEKELSRYRNEYLKNLVEKNATLEQMEAADA